MTPQEEADKLITIHHNLIQDNDGELGQEMLVEMLVTILAKQCALIAVDEGGNNSSLISELQQYWGEIKQEIEKLGEEISETELNNIVNKKP